MRKELITFRDPKSPISEIFRTLRTNIQFMSSHKKLKTILVTSTLPGEGKSWVTSNLAITFAQTGKKVVIIDGDMRKGRLNKIFGTPSKPGLSNYLCDAEFDENTGYEISSNPESDLENYLVETEIDNLWIMPSGHIPPNPSELLVSETMMFLLEKLKENCDVVLIDGTPSDLVTDSIILSRLVDATVIVTAHKKTKKDSLKKVVASIKNVGGNVAGVIYNKVPMNEKKYTEKYYYNNQQDIEINERNRQKGKRKAVKVVEYKEDEEIDDTMEKEVGENVNVTHADRAQDILNQMNEYLDEQKKK